MAKIKKFTEQEDLHYKVGFELTRKEVILLLKLLDDLKDRRSEDVCNDAEKKEEKLFTEDERLEMAKSIWEEEFGENPENMDEDELYLSNYEYVAYIMKRIKDQL